MDRLNLLIRILLLCAAGYLALLVGVTLFQRKLLYIPSHDTAHTNLSEWKHEGEVIGYSRKAASPASVWLFLHGNAGQATDRTYILPSFSDRDSVYILEYPGYGSRNGSPTLQTLNSAARHAYELLTAQFPDTPVCVASESIGSGPASFLATVPKPPEKIVLITPFDRLVDVAAHHYPFLPVRLMLYDSWDNIASLKEYKGELEIFGARSDTIIPVSHAEALAVRTPSAVFHLIDAGHNDWSDGNKVKIRYLPQLRK